MGNKKTKFTAEELIEQIWIILGIYAASSWKCERIYLKIKQWREEEGK